MINKQLGKKVFALLLTFAMTLSMTGYTFVEAFAETEETTTVEETGSNGNEEPAGNTGGKSDLTGASGGTDLTTNNAETGNGDNPEIRTEGLPEAEGQPVQEAEGAIFDGILADLGVSSHQFDTAERGFSFRFDAPLDMRMNTEAGKTAADIVNTYGEAELERILRLYAEVDNPRKAARLIVSAREQEPIRTTGQLDKALAPILPKMAEHKVLAKVYQGLRIEVNQEMHSLEKFLEGAAASLKPGGRLVVITYHSLEDRMVKNFIKTGNVEGREEKDLYGRTHAPLQAVNRKPILPSEEEIARNTRARSAKLRIAEKI